MGLWKEDTCRCYALQSEYDTMHILEYSHNKIKKKREEIINSIVYRICQIEGNTNAI